MKSDLKFRFKFISAIVILIMIALSCGKPSELSSDSKVRQIIFLKKYILDKDECEGKSSKYTPGRLTVMVDIRPSKKNLSNKSQHKCY